MNYIQLKEVATLKNVYVLTGDNYITKSVVDDIATKLNVSSINISKFNEENFDMQMLLNACNQFSFFNEKRIILVEGLLEQIKTADKNMLLSYCENANADCYLLIIDNAEIFSFLKNVEKIECVPSEKFVFDFVKNEFQKNNKNISLQACKKLIEYARADLIRLKLEIKKICDYLGNDCDVSEALVNELVMPDIELKVYELTNKLAEKNVKVAHRILYDMLKSGEPPIKILGLISNFFRRAFYAKISKNSDANLAVELGCKEFAIKKARESVKNFSAKELKDIQNLILETDYNIKSGAMLQENALYYLIMKIAL